MTYLNHLTPPSGTTCFKYQEITYMNGQLEKNGTRTNGQWKTQVYVYPTGASVTDKQGWADSGRLQYVVVHFGTIDVLSGSIAKHTFSLACDPPTQFQPETGSGITQGDDTKYSINYSQTMNVFQGQVPNAFDAQFQNDVVHYRSTQEAELQPYGTKFYIKAGRSQLSHNEIFALSVFSAPTGYYGDISFGGRYAWTTSGGDFSGFWYWGGTVKMPAIPSSSE